MLKHEASYLEGVPSASMYERSFMHRDTVTHVAVAAACDMLLTGSADGHLKFWKKRPGGVEFVKHFRAHKGPIDGGLAAMSPPACTSCSSVPNMGLRMPCALRHAAAHV